MKAKICTLQTPDEIQEKWYLIDAEGCVVGRIASRVAKLVRGKLTPTFAPHQNPKIHVVILNADKAVFTADKLTTKVYYHHSMWRTGVKSTTPAKLLAEKPTEVLRKAIDGMLPRGPLGSRLKKNVRIFAAGQYNGEHDAQQPEPLKIVTRQPKARK